MKAEFQGVGDSGERAFGRVARAADTAGLVVRRVMGILGAAISVRQLVANTDTWTNLRSRVDLATGSQERGALVMDRLRFPFPSLSHQKKPTGVAGALMEAWVGRETAALRLPPLQLALDPSDVLALQHDGRLVDLAQPRMTGRICSPVVENSRAEQAQIVTEVAALQDGALITEWRADYAVLWDQVRDCD